MGNKIIGIMPYYARLPHFVNEVLKGSIESYFLYAFESMQKYCDFVVVSVARREDLDWLLEKKLSRFQPLFYSNIDEVLLSSAMTASVQQDFIRNSDIPFDYIMYSDPWNILYFEQDIKKYTDIIDKDKNIYLTPNIIESAPVSRIDDVIRKNKELGRSDFFRWDLSKVQRKNTLFYLSRNKDNISENYYNDEVYECKSLGTAYSGSYLCHKELFEKVKITFNPENFHYHSGGWDIYKNKNSVPVRTIKKWGFYCDNLSSWDYNAYSL